MQLGRSAPRARTSDDLATALRLAAQDGGHRPALTVLRPDGDGGVRREEQGFAGLAQWTAKGAHLLEADLLAEPGDALALVGPPGWLPVAAALAAWWSGLVVTDDPSTALVVLAHEDTSIDSTTLGADAEVLRWGDAVDGGTSGAGAEEAWSSAVQAFPDAPPPPRATPASTALRPAGGTSLDQRDLLAQVRAAVGERPGTSGLQLALRAASGRAGLGWLVPAAVRPLVTGRATVLLDEDLRRADADGERVAEWLA